MSIKERTELLDVILARLAEGEELASILEDLANSGADPAELQAIEPRVQFASSLQSAPWLEPRPEQLERIAAGVTKKRQRSPIVALLSRSARGRTRVGPVAVPVPLMVALALVTGILAVSSMLSPTSPLERLAVLLRPDPTAQPPFEGIESDEIARDLAVTDPASTTTVAAASARTNTLTPAATPTSERCICQAARDRVPDDVIEDASENPEDYEGWGEPLDPAKPASPTNPLRECLTLLLEKEDYDPIINPVVWKEDCR